jgi:hypothetical protein
MKKTDVPQDTGVFGQWHPVCYATDENGDYVRSQSSGWEPINIANDVAWEFIQEDIAHVLEKVRNGELSPLAYHISKSCMDVKMVAQYAGLSAWKVKRHLKPHIYRSLDKATLVKYASVFKIKPEELDALPGPSGV